MPRYRNNARTCSLNLPNGRAIGQFETFEAAEGEVPAAWLELPVERPEVNGAAAMVELLSDEPA